MKLKSILTALCLALFTPGLHAHTSLEISQNFEEPESGWKQVMQLANGNTFLFWFTKKKGIEVRVFNAKRNQISHKVITSTLWDPSKLGESAIEGIYEIGGQPAIFIQQIKDRTPALFRILIDPQNGSIADEAVIISPPPYKSGKAWAMNYDNIPLMELFVEKDPVSDNYAVFTFNSYAENMDKKIELTHFDVRDGQHTTVNRAFYNLPDNNLINLNYVGMTVTPGQVNLCIYGYPKKWAAGDSRLILSRLGTKDTSFSHRMLDFESDFRSVNAAMTYNPATNILHMLTINLQQSKSNALTGKGTSYYSVVMYMIDPASLTIISAEPQSSEMISQALSRQTGKETHYTGMPQNMVLNRDNSLTILSEESREQVSYKNGRMVGARTYLGNIGISELSSRGQETGGHVIRKNQLISGFKQPFYLTRKGKGIWFRPRVSGMFGDNTAFFFFDYINTEKHKYVLYNELPVNKENYRNPGKMKQTAVASDTRAIYHRLGDRNGPQYLFGNPHSKDHFQFIHTGSAHYQAATDTYATLVISRKGRTKDAHMAWIRFE